MWRNKRAQSRVVTSVRGITQNTTGLKDPRTAVAFHVRLLKWGLRAAQITALDTDEGGKPTRCPYWSAGGWLTCLHWLPGFGKIDELLRGGASAGVMLNADGFTNQQNRLLLVLVPWWLVPPGKRRREKAGRGTYRWDVYDIGATIRTTEGVRYGRYGQFGELVPEVIPRKTRVRRGSQKVWELAGRKADFVRLVVTDDRPEASDRLLLLIAQIVGVLTACALTPVLYPLAAFAHRWSSEEDASR